MAELPCNHEGPGPVLDPEECPRCLRKKIARLQEANANLVKKRDDFYSKWQKMASVGVVMFQDGEVHNHRAEKAEAAIVAWNRRPVPSDGLRDYVKKLAELADRIEKNGNACGIGCDMGYAGPGPVGKHDADCWISEARALTSRPAPEAAKADEAELREMFKGAFNYPLKSRNGMVAYEMTAEWDAESRKLLGLRPKPVPAPSEAKGCRDYGGTGGDNCPKCAPARPPEEAVKAVIEKARKAVAEYHAYMDTKHPRGGTNLDHIPEENDMPFLEAMDDLDAALPPVDGEGKR